MASGFIVRLRPVGPWRLGPSSGARDRVDRVLHSDTLYSALTIAADQIGFVSEWIAATAQAEEPQVRVGSAFPFVGRTLLAPAPRHVWPPNSAGRVRWKAARFVPLHVVPRLLAYESLKEDRWSVDPVSESVLPVERFGEVTPPFRIGIRRTAPVDRVSGASGEASSTACLEWAENAGMWCAVLCAPEWRDRVQALFRFVADAGVGGERSLGWGRSEKPVFEDLPALFDTNTAAAAEHHETGYWMLSLFAPGPADRVDWARGDYALLRRSGRTNGRGELKVESAMVEEGSVLIAETQPAGTVRDIAPEGSAHPVYRAGLGVAIPVAVRLPGFYALERPVEAPAPPSVTPTPEVQHVLELAEQEQPVEDALAEPASEPATELLVVETEPVAEQIPTAPIADGGAFEDGPPIADADDNKPEESA